MRVFPLVLLFILSLGAAGSLFADEDPDDLLRFPTLLKVKYDASPNTGSVVISFEGSGDTDRGNSLPVFPGTRLNVLLSVIEGEKLQYLVPYQNATVSAIDFAPLRC